MEILASGETLKLVEILASGETLTSGETLKLSCHFSNHGNLSGPENVAMFEIYILCHVYKLYPLTDWL